jgi:hypothetical protein
MVWLWCGSRDWNAGRARVIRYKLYATSYTLQSYTQHGKKYTGFSQQLNLSLACLKGESNFPL